MHHRGHDEAESVGTEFQRIPFLDGESIKCLTLKELAQEDQGLGRRHDLDIRILPCQCQDTPGMVRFHMVDHQVVGFPAAQGLLQLRHPLLPLPGIDRVHNGHFFVQDEVRVIGHSFGYDILALEQFQIQVVHADILDFRGQILDHFLRVIISYKDSTIQRNYQVSEHKFRRIGYSSKYVYIC